MIERYMQSRNIRTDVRTDIRTDVCTDIRTDVSTDVRTDICKGDVGLAVVFHQRWGSPLLAQDLQVHLVFRVNR